VAGVGAGLIAKNFFGRAHPLETLLDLRARALEGLKAWRLVDFIFF